MSTIGGQDYTNFRAVNLRGSTTIRLAGTDVAGTVRVDHIEADRAWSFPDKSGRFGVSGTFTVNVPAISANSVHSTNVAVSGIRTEDAVICAIQNTFATIGTTNWAVRGIAGLVGAQAANGGVHLTFANFAATATVYADLTIGYTAVR